MGSSGINMDEAAHAPQLISFLTLLTIPHQAASFQLDFSGLKLLQLAESLSQRKLQSTFDFIQPTAHHRVKRGKKKKRKKTVHKCASSNSGVFAFFAFITLNINVMVDFMFTVMVDIMIMGILVRLYPQSFTYFHLF